MTSTSKTYKDLGIPYFKEVFNRIDHVLKKHQIPYYLIGVSAVSLQLAQKGIKPSRGTRDIDFAIMISTLAQYDVITAELEAFGFNLVKDSPWRLYHPEFNVVIDLLPFGEIEERYTEDFTSRYSDLHMLGFMEVLVNPATVQIEEHIVHVPPLSGMIVLKLISWSDRPEQRENDLADILTVISHFYDLEWKRILKEYAELVPAQGEFDERQFAAHVLGREAGIYLLKSEKIKERILKVLKSNLSAETKSPIAIEWAAKLENTVEYAQRLLQRFLDGLNETLAKTT